MKKIITAILLTLVLTLSPISVILAQDSVNEILSDIQDERITKLEQQLVLSIPHLTDNPNHVVSFTDPSSEKVGVNLEIDGQGFVTIESPYNLPSLGIGKHILTFRFTDNEDAVQNLEKELIVIPRPPVINAPDTIAKDQMTFTGTALAGSTVELFLSGDILNEVATVQVQDSGDWTHTFEGDYQTAIYTIVAITTKNGYASSYSEPVVFELKNGSAVISVNNSDTVNFSFNEFFSGDILQNAKDNIDLLWYGLLTLVLGLGIGILTMKLTSKKQSKDVQEIFTNSISNTPKKEEGDDPKNMSLREKFEQAGYNTIKKEEETPKKEEIKEVKEVKEKKVEEETKVEKEEVKEKVVEEKVEEDKKEETKKETKKSVSKKEFLEEFKEQDPDDKKGKEKQSKKKAKPKKKKEEKMSKSIKIDLTSKQ